MEIKTLVAKAHENAVKHGFWEKKAFASTEVESPKAWPSNWLTR